MPASARFQATRARACSLHRPSARASRASASRAFASARVRSSSACSTRDLRVEHVGARGDAGVEALAHDAPRFGRGAHAVVRGGDRRAARVELEPALPDLERELAIEVGDARRAPRRGRRGLGALGATRPPSHSGQRDVDETSHESCHSSVARKDARVRAGVVESAADRDLRTRRVPRGRVDALLRPRRRAVRAPAAPARLANGLGDECRGRGRRCDWRVERRRGCDRDRPASRPMSRRRSASAIAARVAASIASSRCARCCASADEHIVRAESARASSRLRTSVTCASMRSSDRSSTASVSRAVTSAQKRA